jgi:hypothetical protein
LCIVVVMSWIKFLSMFTSICIHSNSVSLILFCSILLYYKK